MNPIEFRWNFESVTVLFPLTRNSISFSLSFVLKINFRVKMGLYVFMSIIDHGLIFILCYLCLIRSHNANSIHCSDWISLWKFVNIPIVLIILLRKFFKQVGIIVRVCKILYLLELYSFHSFIVKHNLKYHSLIIHIAFNKIIFKLRDVAICIM